MQPQEVFEEKKEAPIDKPDKKEEDELKESVQWLMINSGEKKPSDQPPSK